MSIIVLTVGTFDLFHTGHITLLKYCRSFGWPDGRVVVGVNTDRFVATFKKPPVNSLEERRAVVAACKYADLVITNDAACLEPMLLIVKPDLLLVGQDWAPPRDYMAQIGTTEEWLTGHGITLKFCPRREGSQSSTKIRQKLNG